jgi:hypothetical protein
VFGQGRTWLAGKQGGVGNFLGQEVVWFMLYAAGCAGVFYLVRLYQMLLCPRGLNILRDLGWDDTPDQYFDGIDNALIDRIRDPWNYRPLPFVDVERQHNETRSAEDIKREETASAIREAAQMLRTIKSGPSETSEAESTALASSKAVRRNSKLVSAAEKRSAELAAELAEMAPPAAGPGNSSSKSKWDVWNQIADGAHTGYVGPDDGMASGRSTSSQGTNASSRSFYGASNVAQLTSLNSQSTGPVPAADSRFSSRGSTPKAAGGAGGGGGQWSSRQESTPTSSSSRLGLKLDLSSIQVAPSHVPVPKTTKPAPAPASQQQQQQALRFNEPSADDDEEYSMNLPSLQHQLRPPRLLPPPRLGPPRALGPPPGAPGALGPPRAFAPPSGPGMLGPPPGAPRGPPGGPPPRPGFGPGPIAGPSPPRPGFGPGPVAGPSPRASGPPPRLSGPGAMAANALARPPGMGFLGAPTPSSGGPTQGRRPPPSDF